MLFRGRRWLFVALSTVIALPCCVTEGGDFSLAPRKLEPAGLFSGRDRNGVNSVSQRNSHAKSHRYKHTSIDMEEQYAAAAESRSEDTLLQRSLAVPYQIARGPSMLAADLWNTAFPSGVDDSDQMQSSSSVRTKKTIRRRRRVRNGEEEIEEEEVVVEEKRGLRHAVGKRLMEIPRSASKLAGIPVMMVANGGMMVASGGNEGLQRVRRHFKREEEEITMEWDSSTGMSKREVQRRSLIETSRVAAERDECAVSSSSWRSSSSSTKVSNNLGAGADRSVKEARDVLPIAARQKADAKADRRTHGRTRSIADESGRQSERNGDGAGGVAMAGQWSGGRALNAVLDLGWLRLELEEGVWDRTVERMRVFGVRVAEQGKRVLEALGVLGARLGQILKVMGVRFGEESKRVFEMLQKLCVRMGEEGKRVGENVATGLKNSGASAARRANEFGTKLGSAASEVWRGLRVVLGEGRGVTAVCVGGLALFYAPLFFLPP